MKLLMGLLLTSNSLASPLVRAAHSADLSIELAPEFESVAPPAEIEPELTQPELPSEPIPPDPITFEAIPQPLPETPVETVISPSNEAIAEPDTLVIIERSSGCEAAVSVGNALGSQWCEPEPEAPVASISKPEDSSLSQWLPAPDPVANQWDEAIAKPSSLAEPGEGLYPAPYTPTLTITESLPDSVKQLLGRVRVLFPLTIPAPFTSLFGWRIHPITGDRRFHAGVDLGAPQGTPILAAVGGQVVIADYLDGYGLTVIVNHGSQETLYAHLSEITVQSGQHLQQGTVLGRVGSTGYATGPHLHLEVRQWTTTGWVAVNPSLVLKTALAQMLQSHQIAQQLPAPRLQYPQVARKLQ